MCTGLSPTEIVAMTSVVSSEIMETVSSPALVTWACGGNDRRESYVSSVSHSSLNRTEDRRGEERLTSLFETNPQPNQAPDGGHVWKRKSAVRIRQCRAGADNRNVGSACRRPFRSLH
jgi:hypothetical protein